MADTTAIRTSGGQVLNVPAMRLDWGTEQRELVDLFDQVGEILRGLPGEGALVAEGARMAVLVQQQLAGEDVLQQLGERAEVFLAQVDRGANMTQAERLAIFGRFVEEVRKVSGHEGAVVADVTDVFRLHAALRGVRLSDPTPAPPAG